MDSETLTKISTDYTWAEVQDAVRDRIKFFFPKHKVLLMTTQCTDEQYLALIESIKLKPNIIVLFFFPEKTALLLGLVNKKTFSCENVCVVYNIDNYWTIPESRGLTFNRGMFKDLSNPMCSICLEESEKTTISPCCSANICYECGGGERMVKCPICCTLSLYI